MTSKPRYFSANYTFPFPIMCNKIEVDVRKIYVAPLLKVGAIVIHPINSIIVSGGNIIVL